MPSQPDNGKTGNKSLRSPAEESESFFESTTASPHQLDEAAASRGQFAAGGTKRGVAKLVKSGIVNVIKFSGKARKTPKTHTKIPNKAI